MIVVKERWLITDQTQVSNYERGLESIAFDTQDLTKLGTPKKVLIKKTANGVELVLKVAGSNLTGYDKLTLIDLTPTHLTASVEETRQFIDNPNVIVERVLSSGARFTEEDLHGLPKEAHSLIYKVDSNGARIFNVINVNPNKEYTKYGIKSQVERKVARILVAYCDNASEMSKLTKEQRQASYMKYNIKLVEFNDYLQANPNYKSVNK